MAITAHAIENTWIERGDEAMPLYDFFFFWLAGHWLAFLFNNSPKARLSYTLIIHMWDTLRSLGALTHSQNP